MQQRTKPVKIDVAATDNNADTLALQFATHGAGRCKPEAAGRLDYQLHAFGKETHAIDDKRGQARFN